MTVMLGLHVDAGGLKAEPVVPTGLLPLRLTGIPAGGRRWDVQVADGISVTEHASG
jgi:hypothetical protein